MHLHRKVFTKYFVVQSSHKVFASASLQYKACTKHVPVLLCITKLAQSTPSIYYFVLQSLHKVLPSTTLYYKACTKYFPVLLCTAKLAHSTSEYYCVLRSLHKARPSTTLYYKASQYYSTLCYKACTKHFPVLLCTDITMRFPASRGSPASLYAHSNITWQKSCSQHTAICKHRLKKRIEA